ncbi:SCO3242 family prenyltransferase [Embleya sp. NPDC005575]|uniref:SCO3242 family prenyltransferase n=1 Tax=Embleya sp. NPDC005575 TaxID=3156892 RepID=UPI0033AF82D2
MGRGRWRAFAELVRVPAALSVPGDVLVGAAASGGLLRGREAALPVASVCLYWAGMALNDYADRDLDAKERPDRPIPSGRISPDEALATAAGLTAAGMTIGAWAGGRRRLPAVLGLAGAVWTYDLVLKGTPAAPMGMALARGLDVMVGARPGRAGGLTYAAGYAGVVALHTYGVTALSRHEEHGTTAGPPVVALATAVATTVAAGVVGRGRPAGWSTRGRLGSRGGAGWDRVGESVSGAGLVSYLAAYGRPLVRAIADPRAGRIRAAVGGGVLALLPLQAAVLSRLGRPRAALVLSAAWPGARALARVVSPT